MPALSTKGQKGGELAGVPNIYLIYWARLTDFPLLAFGFDMTVRFVFCGDESFFSFPYEFVRRYCILHKDIYPNGVRTTYCCDTDMFNFLDSQINPSSLERIVTTMDCSESNVALIYNIDFISIDDIERFFVPLDDLPF